MNETRFSDEPVTRVRKAMEIITADGRSAGHVDTCSANQIFVSQSGQAIPKEWIRRVDREVFIQTLV